MANIIEENKNKKSVFVVEDEAPLVVAYQSKLKKIGVDTRVAATGKEALKFVESREIPNLVLLDLRLPDIDGFEVLAAIRQNERWRNVPVVVLSNLSSPQDMKRAKELGAREYIVKANMPIQEVVQKLEGFLS